LDVRRGSARLSAMRKGWNTRREGRERREYTEGGHTRRDGTRGHKTPTVKHGRKFQGELLGYGRRLLGSRVRFKGPPRPYPTLAPQGR
jgi:hypothetical protein